MSDDKRRILSALCDAGCGLFGLTERQKHSLMAIGLTPEIIRLLIDLHHKDEERRRVQREKRKRQQHWCWQHRTPEEIARQRMEIVKQAEERDAERQLGLRLIGAGYRGAAKEYRGDTVAMRHLNRARDRLRKSI
jgi:hypothetical protein